MQELKFDPERAVHVLETLPKNVDVGKYIFSFEVHLLLPDFSLFQLYVSVFPLPNVL